jgi:aspartyl/asparaginyl-tRNA synthetase
MTEFTGLDLEMEIKNDYSEVLLMLEGVLLHIFRGLKGMYTSTVVGAGH